MSMVNCPECNSLVSDKATACPTCGYPISVNQTQTVQNTVSQQQAPQMHNSIPYQETSPMSNTVFSQDIPQFGQQHSNLYPQIRAFADAVKSIYTLSIVGLVLCMGIGFILALINISRINKLVPIKEPINNPYDLAEYQAAERKLKTARTLSGITLIAAGLAIILGFFIGVFSQL